MSNRQLKFRAWDKLEKRNAFLGIAASYINTIGTEYKKHFKKIEKLDLKRKEVRMERKKYNI